MFRDGNRNYYKIYFSNGQYIRKGLDSGGNICVRGGFASLEAVKKARPCFAPGAINVDNEGRYRELVQIGA